MKKCHIQEQYEEVRRDFFPRWDRQKNWSLHVIQDLDGAHGRCDAPHKRIVSGFNGDELVLVLIHEIAHAVVSGGHGKKWQARMERAAIAAEGLGRMELAGLLRKEIAGYSDPLARVTAAGVYSEIEDAIIGVPQANFLQVVDWVRREYGLNRQEFFRRFRRAKAVYQEARRWCRELMELKAAMLASGNGGIS
jgi:hypothetical protein